MNYSLALASLLVLVSCFIVAAIISKMRTGRWPSHMKDWW